VNTLSSTYTSAILLKLLQILKDKNAIQENDPIVFVSGVLDPHLKSQFQMKLLEA